MVCVAITILVTGCFTGAWAGPITAVSITGQGEHVNDPSLLMDGVMLPPGTAFDDPACVHWSDPKLFFLMDLGAVYVVDGIVAQVDNDDDYLVEASLDGKKFVPLVSMKASLGAVDWGMQTLGTVHGQEGYVSELAVTATSARYLRLSATAGDGVYAVSELTAHGSPMDKTSGKTVTSLPGRQPAGQSRQVAAASDGGQDDGDLAEVFDAVDIDHDGRLSRDEYAAIWKSGTDVEKKFRFFDRDGSGFIERQEFLALPGQMQ
jgi:hypothetical protein